MTHPIVVRLRKKDLEPFKKLQRVSFEVGGIMDITENGLERMGLVTGGENSIKASQLPKYTVQYHTHPSYPQLPSEQDAIEFSLKSYRNGKTGENFPIDALVQTISDTDLSTFSKSLIEGDAQVMMIFAPEGIYVLSPNSNIDDFKKNTSKGDQLKILKNESESYLKNRNDKIVKKEKELQKSMKNKSKEEQIRLLCQFQKDIGRKIAEFITQNHIIMNVLYFPWDTNEVSFSIQKMPEYNKYNTRRVFSELMPH